MRQETAEGSFVRQDAPQATLVEDHYVVETLATDCTHHAFAMALPVAVTARFETAAKRAKTCARDVVNDPYRVHPMFEIDSLQHFRPRETCPLAIE